MHVCAGMCDKCNCSSTVCDASMCVSHEKEGKGSNTNTKPGGLVSALKGVAMILHVGDYAYNMDR